MPFRCNGCDAERLTIRAYCPHCEEVTESYSFDGGEREKPWHEIVASFHARPRPKVADIVSLNARIDALREKRLSDPEPDLDIEHVERVAWGMGR